MQLECNKVEALISGRAKSILGLAAYYKLLIIFLLFFIFSTQYANAGEAIPREGNFVFDTIIYFIFIILLLVFAMIRIVDQQYFNDLFNATIDSSTHARLRRDGKLGFHLNDVLLDLNFIIVSSLLVFSIAGFTEFEHLLSILLVVAAFYLLKVIIAGVFSLIFYAETMSAHLQNILLFNKAAGVALLPFAFVLFFAPGIYNDIIVKVILGFVALIFLYRFVRVLFKLNNDYHYGILYYLLYLCATEISPYLIIFKRFTGLF